MADVAEEDDASEEMSHSTQRRRQQMPVDDESDSDDFEHSVPVAREGIEIDDSETESKDQLVKKLVRYALACEYQRLPIRREGIRDKGLSLRSILGTLAVTDRLYEQYLGNTRHHLSKYLRQHKHSCGPNLEWKWSSCH